MAACPVLVLLRPPPRAAHAHVIAGHRLEPFGFPSRRMTRLFMHQTFCREGRREREREREREGGGGGEGEKESPGAWIPLSL